MPPTFYKKRGLGIQLGLLSLLPGWRLFLTQALGDQAILVERRNNSLLAAKILIVVMAGLADIENLNVRQFSSAVLVHKLVEEHRSQSGSLFAKCLLCAEDISGGGGRGDDVVRNVLRHQFGEAGEELRCIC